MGDFDQWADRQAEAQRRRQHNPDVNPVSDWGAIVWFVVLALAALVIGLHS